MSFVTAAFETTAFVC